MELIACCARSSSAFSMESERRAKRRMENQRGDRYGVVVSDSDLCLAAQNGDTNAEAEVVARYQHLAAQAANKSSAIGVSDRGDLYAIGLYAIVRAIREYDPSRGCAFGAYCRRAISNAITDTARATRRRSMPTISPSDPVDASEYFVSDPHALGDMEASETFQLLQTLRSALDTPFEMVVFDLLAREHTTVEIASITGYSRTSVWRTINKIRAMAHEMGVGDRR